MAIERADILAVTKPWGIADVRPWSDQFVNAGPIGELWFQRAAPASSPPALLLKLLFTSQPLSIQVHPSDEIARSMGLDHGKSEAWYILSAGPDSKVAVGLKHPVTPQVLREAIENGTIVDLVRWNRVRTGDVIQVPAGTIHAIGAGVVVAEIQQRSDATFRLFDYGSDRELQIEAGIAAANLTSAPCQRSLMRLTQSRILLTACDHLVLERIELPPNSQWQLDTVDETWLLVLEGQIRSGLVSAGPGEALFVDAECPILKVGGGGAKGLITYGGPVSRPGILANVAVDNVKPLSRARFQRQVGRQVRTFAPAQAPSVTR